MASTFVGKLHELVSPFLDERSRRLLAAGEALALGRGGISSVARETGMSRPTIMAGIKQLRTQEAAGVPPTERVRREGGGRKQKVETIPGLAQALESLVEPVTRGDPESPLRWTCKSLRKLADELGKQGYSVSHRLVGDLLENLGYSLQANRKTNEGGNHPDRDAQFQHINATVKGFLAAGQPAISVDTKKKELVGDFKNAGRELRPIGTPERVRVHDFPIPELGKVAPYGVYDIANNAAWVSVGTDHDTAAFAVASIKAWWFSMGKAAYPNAKELLITADCGGSNGYRVRLWKTELQKLATLTNLTIRVCHLPPGTSKWNKIEHRLFSFITQNWRGKPLVSHEVIVNLIAATTTRTGLTVKCEMNTNDYPLGTVVPDDEFADVRITPDDFHGEWNYEIRSKYVKVVV
ncbi:MAG: ISAzo13 family transposase [Capsulimonadaceae bacterium]|nr:ISAzo13 family transposase [Capsulimonadaceae bacterium]